MSTIEERMKQSFQNHFLGGQKISINENKSKNKSKNKYFKVPIWVSKLVHWITGK